MDELFSTLARRTERWIGSPWAFIAALASIVVWGITGPMFGFSDTWQMVINTATTIITYLIVFLIQATQTRDTTAIHVKLDELLRAVGEARTPIALAEELPQTDLDALRDELHETARREQREGGPSS